MASATGEDSSHEHTIPWFNTAIDEIEAIRVRIREAEERQREKVDKLSKTEGRLAKIQGNRKKPPRDGGKCQFQTYQHLRNRLTIFHPALEDEVRDLVAKFQDELQETVLNIEAMEIELQVLQGNVEPPSAPPLQTSEPNIPGGPTAGENMTPPTDSNNVHEQKADPNQEDSNAHNEASVPVVDPEQADAADFANPTNAEANNLAVTANEHLGESSPNDKKLILMDRDRTYTPAKFLS